MKIRTKYLQTVKEDTVSYSFSYKGIYYINNIFIFYKDIYIIIYI